MAIHEKVHRDGVRFFVLDFRDQHRRRIREQLFVKTKGEAKDLYRRRLVEVTERTYRHPTLDAPVPDPAPPLTLAKFIEDTFKPGYAALRSSEYYANICLPIVRHMGEVPLAEIDGARISDYVTLRSTESVSAATIRKELGALGTILRHASFTGRSALSRSRTSVTSRNRPGRARGGTTSRRPTWRSCCWPARRPRGLAGWRSS